MKAITPPPPKKIALILQLQYLWYPYEHDGLSELWEIVKDRFQFADVSWVKVKIRFHCASVQFSDGYTFSSWTKMLISFLEYKKKLTKIDAKPSLMPSKNTPAKIVIITRKIDTVEVCRQEKTDHESWHEGLFRLSRNRWNLRKSAVGVTNELTNPTFPGQGVASDAQDNATGIYTLWASLIT